MAHIKIDIPKMNRILRTTQLILVKMGNYMLTEDRVIKKRKRTTHPIVREYREMLQAFGGLLKALGSENGNGLKPKEPSLSDLLKDGGSE